MTVYENGYKFARSDSRLFSLSNKLEILSRPFYTDTECVRFDLSRSFDLLMKMRPDRHRKRITIDWKKDHEIQRLDLSRKKAVSREPSLEYDWHTI